MASLTTVPVHSHRWRIGGSSGRNIAPASCLIREPHHGFSLLEVMVTLLLVAAMATMAVPTYRGWSARDHRRAAIDGIQQRVWQHEWHLLVHTSGRSRAVEGATAPADRADSSQEDIGRNAYAFYIRETAVKYWVEAVPASRGPMRSDRCGTFRLGSDGAHANVDANGRLLTRAESARCWALR